MKRSAPFALAILLGAVPAVIAQSSSTDYSPERRLEMAVESGSATREQQLELARIYIDAGRYYEARRLADQVLTSNAGDADATRIRERAVAGLREGAARDLPAIETRARAEGATYADRLAYARALAAARRMHEAESIYAEILGPTPDAEMQLEYGRLLSWMGVQDLAIETLTRANASLHSEASAIALANAYAWDRNRERGIEVLSTYIASDPDAIEAQRLRETMRSSQELRVERLDRQIAADPYNLALRMERARILYDMGDWGEAHRTLEFVHEHARGDVEGLVELDRQLEEYRQSEMARLDDRRAALGTMTSSSENGAGPARDEEMLSLAKAYSGIAAYDESIALYEQYLAAHPDDVDARVRYARVLSWDRRYGAAQDQYSRLIAQYPHRSDLRLEYAQNLSWQREYTPAMREFQTLTDLSGNPSGRLYGDVPARAHFHRGQIYRWFGWNDHAAKEQNAALGLDSTYEPSLTELDRIRNRRPAGALEARYTSSTDSNDFTLHRADLMGESWLNNRLAIQAGLGQHNFERNEDSVNATAFYGGARYRHTDRFLTRARVGFNVWTDDLGTRGFWGLGHEYLPNIQSRVAIDYNHYDLIYDVFALQTIRLPGPGGNVSDPLAIDDFRLHYDHTTGGRLSWLADASYGFISDDNERRGARGLVSYTLFHQPFVAIKADGRILSYDFRTNRYWSPDDYRSLAGVLQVGQNLSRFEWSAELKLGKAWERDRASDLRAFGVNVTVPVSDRFDIVGDWGYGKTGRFDSVLGDGDGEFTNYWRRNWFVGVRVKQLFARTDRNAPTEPYYYDNRVLTTSPVIPPVGEN